MGLKFFFRYLKAMDVDLSPSLLEVPAAPVADSEVETREYSVPFNIVSIY